MLLGIMLLLLGFSSREVRDLLQHHNIEALYIPPYSPRCNPIEEVFSLLKRKFRTIFMSANNLEESIDKRIYTQASSKRNTMILNNFILFLKWKDAFHFLFSK